MLESITLKKVCLDALNHISQAYDLESSYRATIKERPTWKVPFWHFGNVEEESKKSNHIHHKYTGCKVLKSKTKHFCSDLPTITKFPVYYEPLCGIYG